MAQLSYETLRHVREQPVSCQGMSVKHDERAVEQWSCRLPHRLSVLQSRHFTRKTPNLMIVYFSWPAWDCITRVDSAQSGLSLWEALSDGGSSCHGRQSCSLGLMHLTSVSLQHAADANLDTRSLGLAMVRKRFKERWLSGRKRRFAKSVKGSNPSAGSNPVRSA